MDKIKQLKEKDSTGEEIAKVISLIKNIIVETERQGTGGTKPHSAILNGPLLD